MEFCKGLEKPLMCFPATLGFEAMSLFLRLWPWTLSAFWNFTGAVALLPALPFRESLGTFLKEGSSSMTSLPCTCISQSGCSSPCLLDEEMSGLMSCRCPHRGLLPVPEPPSCLGNAFLSNLKSLLPLFYTNRACFTSNSHCSAPECPNSRADTLSYGRAIPCHHLYSISVCAE